MLEVLKGFSSERRIYESALVGQTTIALITCLKKLNVSGAFLTGGEKVKSIAFWGS